VQLVLVECMQLEEECMQLVQQQLEQLGRIHLVRILPLGYLEQLVLVAWMLELLVQLEQLVVERMQLELEQLELEPLQHPVELLFHLHFPYVLELLQHHLALG
jgi:hypothetical protein